MRTKGGPGKKPDKLIITKANRVGKQEDTLSGLTASVWLGVSKMPSEPTWLPGGGERRGARFQADPGDVLFPEVFAVLVGLESSSFSCGHCVDDG